MGSEQVPVAQSVPETGMRYALILGFFLFFGFFHVLFANVVSATATSVYLGTSIVVFSSSLKRDQLLLILHQLNEWRNSKHRSVQ